MGRGLEIEIMRRGAELKLSGRMDARSATGTRGVLHEAIDDGGGDLVLHLGGLEIWDGTALGVLAGAGRRARRAGRRLVLVDVRPRELRLLRAGRVTHSALVRAAGELVRS